MKKTCVISLGLFLLFIPPAFAKKDTTSELTIQMPATKRMQFFIKPFDPKLFANPDTLFMQQLYGTTKRQALYGINLDPENSNVPSTLQLLPYFDYRPCYICIPDYGPIRKPQMLTLFQFNFF